MNAPELQQLAAQLLTAAPAPNEPGPATDPSNTAPPPVVIPAAAPAAPVVTSNMPIAANAVAPTDGTVNASVQQSMPVPSTPEQVAAAQQAAQTTASDGLPLTPQQAATRHAGVVAQDLPAMDQNVAGKFSSNREDIADAADETKESAAETTAAKIKQQHAEDSGLNDLANIAASDLKAKQEAETWKINTTNEVMNADKLVRDESLKLAQRNPEDLWGNATTGGKIAGILGIVAAGLSHPGGATERLTQMVNESVAAQANKLKYLKAYGEANHNLLVNAENVFASREAAHESVKAAMLQQVAVKVQQAIAGTKDQTHLAQLHEVLANVDMKRAEANQKSMQIEMGLRVGLAAQTAGLEKTQMMANAKAQGGGDFVEIEGSVGKISRKATQSISKIQTVTSGARSWIDTLTAMERYAKAYEQTKDPRYLAEYNAAQSQGVDAFRIFVDTGAAISKPEYQTYKKGAPSWVSKLDPTGFLKALGSAEALATKRFIRDHTRDTYEQYGQKQIHYDPHSPIWASLEQELGDEDQEVNAAIAGNAPAKDGKPNSGSRADWDKIMGNLPVRE